MNRDDELMLAVAGGDQRAYESLVSRYYKRMFSYFRKNLRSVEDADDAVQNLFLKVFLAAPTYQPTGDFLGFLFVAARNLVIDHSRLASTKFSTRLERGDERTEGHSGDLFSSVEGDARDPADVAAGREEAATLRSAVAKLPAEQASTVLAYADGWSLTEIGEWTNESKRTAQSRLRLGRDRLQQDRTCRELAIA